MSALADLLQAPVLGQHYSSFDDLRKNELAQAKQQIVPLITVLPVVKRAIMLGLVKSITNDTILVLLI